ncbi:putative NAD(P)H nitroreductase [Mycobacterium kansasii 824]|nr:putative NAD(P)H nitroreductase [Mycobacterium kansasii 824]
MHDSDGTAGLNRKGSHECPIPRRGRPSSGPHAGHPCAFGPQHPTVAVAGGRAKPGPVFRARHATAQHRPGRARSDHQLRCRPASLCRCVGVDGLARQGKPTARSGQPRHLAAIEVRAQDADHADIALAAAIPRRRTDRRVYSSWPVAGGDVAQMAARAARCGVMLRQVDALDKMRSIVAQAVWRHAGDEGYIRELTTWSGRYGGVAGFRPGTLHRRIAAPRSLAGYLRPRRWPNPPVSRPPTTAASSWHWAPTKTTGCLGCGQGRQPAPSC